MARVLRCCALLLLVSCFTLEPAAAEGKGPWLHRRKRTWISAPRVLKENHDYTGLHSIARIRSDKENEHKIFYELKGPGVDQPPIGVFSINRTSGYVKIHSILDREEIAYYYLKGVARYRDGSFAEHDIDLNITVEDVNDCAPVIKAQQVGSVSEASAEGTVVMRVIATDADQANTIRSQIYYSIDPRSNPDGMFYINSATGEVMVRRTSLDRETKDSYKLMITASDMNGQSGGLAGGGEVEIKLLDINDNIVTLERESYSGSIQENMVNTEVMRVQAIDMDMMHSDNWLAVYEIVSGNEAGYFSIKTDAKTNEGIIMINNKALDYEELKTLNLGIAVANKAKYNFGSGMQQIVVPKSYPVTINVLNQKEGPRFQPGVKVVTLSEDIQSFKQIITNYAAIDSDTLQTATGVKYAKIRDDDNWLIIDEKTADIRLNKAPDRESKFLINGTYYAEIICINNDSPAKTATGTIAIQVEDFNDHCPKLTTTAHTMCLEDNVIYATAVDEDEYPNSAPFEFTVIGDKSKGKWTVEPFNDTTTILRDNANLWPGSYKVAVEVKDMQGKSCGDVQMIDVTVCTCEGELKACGQRRTKTTDLGVGGILLLLLGLLLLLLVPLLLLFCLCGGAGAGDFKAIPFDTKQQLISYHTEGQGEDKEVPLLHVPVEVDGGAATLKNVNTYEGHAYLDGLTEMGGAAMGGGGGGGGFGMNTSTMTAEEFHMFNKYKHFAGQEEAEFGGAGMGGMGMRYGMGLFDGMALSESFLEEYYTNKSNHAAQQSQQKDVMMVYDYEGQESPAGSVGCCSLLSNDNDLAFLDDLGPKFKTLAEICQGSSIQTHSAGVSVRAARPSASSHTNIHTHTETVRDRDHVSIQAVDTSNMATESSTVIQEERVSQRTQVPTVHIQEKIMVPSQTLLVQQPAMYYAAAPMYMVESQPQMVLVTGGVQQQAVGQVAQVGLGQGLVQVGGIQGSQGVVLVDRQMGVVDGAMGHVAQGLSHGTASRSKNVLVVGGGSSGGLQGQGFTQGLIQTGHVAQGLSQGTASRSKKVVLVGHGDGGGLHGQQLAQGFLQTGQGSVEQSFEVRGHSLEGRGPHLTMTSLGSAGLSEDLAASAAPRLQGSQKVVVQHKKVSVTERNVESNTRA